MKKIIRSIMAATALTATFATQAQTSGKECLEEHKTDLLALAHQFGQNAIVGDITEQQRFMNLITGCEPLKKPMNEGQMPFMLETCYGYLSMHNRQYPTSEFDDYPKPGNWMICGPEA